MVHAAALWASACALFASVASFGLCSLPSPRVSRARPSRGAGRRAGSWRPGVRPWLAGRLRRGCVRPQASRPRRPSAAGPGS